MKLKLIDFIKTAATQDHQKFLSKQNHKLYKDFAKFLGYERWHTPYLRPDNDPKWSPFKWSIDRECCVSNVRVMTVTHMAANTLKEIAIERNLSFPNGWKIDEVIDTLFEIRRAFKAETRKIIVDCMGTYSYIDQKCDYHTWQIIAKYLINTLYSVICLHGTNELGPHHINERMRIKTTEMVQKISETATVLYVYCDEIVYHGNQVDIPGVHHEKFNTAIFGSRDQLAYGNNITMRGYSHCKLSIDEWEPSSFYSDSPEVQRQKALSRYKYLKDKFKKSLFDYIAITKEDIDRQNAIDSECDPL